MKLIAFLLYAWHMFACTPTVVLYAAVQARVFMTDKCGVYAGRPADVLPLPDGSLLVSDDGAGAVYRITYSAELAASSAANATADSTDFAGGVLPELILAPAPAISTEAASTAG